MIVTRPGFSEAAPTVHVTSAAGSVDVAVPMEVGAYTALFVSGRLRLGDTIDDAFGFAFGAFPAPFNTPYVRTDNEVLSSGATGHFVNLAGLVRLGERRTLRVRDQS